MGGRTRWVWACWWLIACGSSPPAEAPDAEMPPADEAAPSAAEAEAPAEAAASAPATGEDVSQILQLVVNDEELDKFLQLGQPGRFPLKVAGQALPSDLQVVKATEPVKVVDGPKDKKDPVLVFTEIDVSGSKATVRYQYDVEGIRGTATLNKGPHGWELVSSRIVER